MADIGVVGLAVMGQNLVLNLLDHNFSVAVYNRTVSKVDEFLRELPKGKLIVGSSSLQDFCSQLKRPRKILLMIKAGTAVDEFLEQILPYLEDGDVIIDGGNSHFADTQRRLEFLKKKNIYFVGAGISGGEEGARKGPSIMPGGSIEAWPLIAKILQSIAAKTADNKPCCDWIGEGGSGHFVKMVHNGIEYGIMQLICESYELLKDLAGLNNQKIAGIFDSWNQGPLQSYLIEITAKILVKRDNDSEFLVNKILDVAGQKGTGKWVVESALNLGVAAPLFAEASFARDLSVLKEERTALSKLFKSKSTDLIKSSGLLKKLESALYLGMIISYAQGFAILQKASLEYKWNLNFALIATIWQQGCIIRSALLKPIAEASFSNNLLFDPFFQKELLDLYKNLKEIVLNGLQIEVALPAFASCLTYIDGLKSENLPISLLQAQRDYFGAHQYERKDRKRGEFFHTQW